MSAPLPMTFTTTCDIYRVGTNPPSAPAVSGVKCHLEGRFRNIKTAATYTHIMYVPIDTDIRDGFGGGTQNDSLYVPDKSGTQFKTVFVERIRWGAGNDYLRVYLTRQIPAFPTNQL
jgi:hypothetical protein